MNISKQAAPPPPVYTPDDAGGGSLVCVAQGRGQRGHKGKCVLCESEQSQIPLHICPITAHQHQAEAREQRGVHLSLFDSMFNDRLTKGLQMCAGDVSPPPSTAVQACLLCIAWSQSDFS